LLRRRCVPPAQWQKAKIAALCVLFWSAPLVADRLYSRAMLGDRATSLAGRHMFAKGALVELVGVDRAGPTPLERKLGDFAQRGVAPVRSLLAPLRGTNVHSILTLNYEVCLQYACTDAATRSLQSARPNLNEALLRVGLARLRQNPLGYLELSWHEYRGLWLLHPRKVPELAREYNAYLGERGPLPFQQYLGEEARPVPAGQQHGFYRLDRALLIAIGVLLPLLMVVLLVAVARSWRHPLLTASLATLIGVHAVLVFTALFGVGIPRYTMGLWPAIVFAVALPAWFAAERAIALARADRQSGEAG
jgi:hypothetical protein